MEHERQRQGGSSARVARSGPRRRLLVGAASTVLLALTTTLASALPSTVEATRTQVPTQAATGSWPQLQADAAHTGVATDTTLDRTALTALSPAWSHTLPVSSGSAGPVVSGGLVYVDDAGISAYRVSDGALAWHTDLPLSGGQTTVTPAVEAGILVTGGELAAVTPGRRGAVWGLDAATGAVRWTRYLAQGVTRAVAVSHEGVYVTSGGQLHKLRLASGLRVWSSTAPADSAPSIDGNRVLVSEMGIGTIHPLTVSAVDASTGAVRWTRTLKKDGGCGAWQVGTVLVAHRVGYVGDCYGTLKAVVTFGGRSLWTTTHARAFFWPMASAGGILLSVDSSTGAAAVDLATGVERWTATESQGLTYSPSPVVVGDTLLLPGSGVVDLRDLASGTLVGRVDLRSRATSLDLLAVAEGHVVLFANTSTARTLVALAPSAPAR